MIEGPYIAEAAALIGDPARASILSALMDGRALTATELAHVAGVTPQTASGHLAKLKTANMVVVERQGRHRYYRLGGPEIAHAIEALSVIAQTGAPRHRPTGPRDQAMRYARTCYDHLAGQVAVAVVERFVELGYIIEGEENFDVSAEGVGALGAFGVEIETLRGQRRAFARRCLDWSERRAHIGGALGAAFLNRCEAQGWLKTKTGSRSVIVTDAGRTGLSETFGIKLPAL
jgi:DNA-binding transcriptional ArsR family regulator